MESPTIRLRDKVMDTPDEFFRAHAGAVYAYALRRTSDASASEDITAEVFLEAVKHAKKRTKSDPLPWLYGVARRKVANHLRTKARRPAQGLDPAIHTNLGDPHQSAETSAANFELKASVDSLPPDQKEALLLHYVEDLSAESIATAMNKSVAAVNSLLQRARQNLRNKVSDPR